MFSGGNGTESDPYLINTVGDVRVLAKNVNNGTSYQGIFFKVDKPEIDFSGVTPIPIGTITGINSTGGSPYYLGNAFIGTLDGNGVIIKNWSSNKGLLINIGKFGVVKDIIMDATCIITGTGNVGGIAGVSEGNILNCINRADISSTGYHIGGICGDNMGTISDCKNYGNIIGKTEQYNSTSGSMIGGIAGDTDGGQSGNLHNAIIRNCENYGTVSGASFEVGGIVGLVTGNSDIIDGCLNQGDVTGTYNIGGITGSYDQTVSVTNNLVTSCTITGTNTSSPIGAGAISPGLNRTSANNYYTKDVIVKVGTNTYDNNTPRGIWDSGPVDVENNNGAVMVTAFGTGDADGDGSVDVNDVTSTINYILGKPVNKFVLKAADVDGDDTIDVNDVQGIIDIALGK
jgi:hypothetical protein